MSFSWLLYKLFSVKKKTTQLHEGFLKTSILSKRYNIKNSICKKNLYLNTELVNV